MQKGIIGDKTGNGTFALDLEELNEFNEVRNSGVSAGVVPATLIPRVLHGRWIHTLAK